MFTQKHIIPLITAGLLTACGGGGGSSSSTNTGTNVHLADAQQAYTGLRSSAIINSDNGLDFVNLVLGTENINDNVNGASTVLGSRPSASTSSNHLLHTQEVLAELVSQQIQQHQYQARGIEVSGDCPVSGTARLVGELGDTTGTGTLQVTYNQCRKENVQTSGIAQIIIEAINLALSVPTQYTLNMNGLNVQLNDTPYSITGTLKTNLDATTLQRNLTLYQHHRNLADGSQALIENNTTMNSLQDYSSINGKVCIGNQGCVEVKTTQQFLFDDKGVALSGEMLLSGANNSQLHVTAQGYDNRVEPPLRQMLLQLDTNGDGNYDQTLPSN